MQQYTDGSLHSHGNVSNIYIFNSDCVVLHYLHHWGHGIRLSGQLRCELTVQLFSAVYLNNTVNPELSFQSNTSHMFTSWMVTSNSTIYKMHRCVSMTTMVMPTCHNVNLLKPTCYVMHQQFNIQQLYALPALYLCVLYLSENKQRLVPLTA